MPQGFLFFPGIQSTLDWNFTFSAHGIQPSVAQLTITPQFGLPASVGPMVITDLLNTEIEFFGCAVDKATVRRDASAMIVGVSILDRRWRWRYGEINGRYNLRLQDGTIDQSTQQTPQEMATLLFNAMGEFNIDVSQLPNLTFPQVDWVSTNPASELQTLCESLGCRVVMGFEDFVSIQPVGEGEDLPDLPALQLTRNFGIDPADQVDNVKVVCGQTRFQTTFRLEAVGQEPDIILNGVKISSGAILPINDLSYKPASANGWGDLFPNSSDSYGNVKSTTGATDQECRSKAQQWVYRAYRIRCTAESNADNTFMIQGVDDDVDVENRWQILPTESGLIDTYLEDDVETNLPPKLEGLWYDNSGDAANNAQVRTFKDDFNYDNQRGIIHLSRPLIKYSPATGVTSPADLYLTIAHPVVDPDTHQVLRYSVTVSLGGDPTGAGPAVDHRADVQRTLIGQYKADGTHFYPSGITDNIGTIAPELGYYLQALLATFESVPTDQAEYTGIIFAEPDGAIQQIQWAASESGAFTTISRNGEHDPRVPPYGERVNVMKHRELLKDLKRILQNMVLAVQPGPGLWK